MYVFFLYKKYLLISFIINNNNILLNYNIYYNIYYNILYNYLNNFFIKRKLIKFK